jgi:hypothetical protein
MAKLFLVTLVVIVLLQLPCCAQTVPSWNMPVLKPWHYPYGGASVVEGAEYIQLFQASKSIGTYNMSPMISYYHSMFLATWKNSPEDEDQPGQRVLYSQSLDGKNWTDANSGERILFPNISTNAVPTALFAEPTLLLNNRVYAAASPIQFCLYPDQYQEYLLLREVFDDFDSFGPIFWASWNVPLMYIENSHVHQIISLSEMPTYVQQDVALLNNTSPTYRPCDPNHHEPGHSAKCEYCANGCQNWTDVTVSTIENERTHYLLPESAGDVILYRNKGQLPNHLYASVRMPLDAPWPPVAETNITDDVSNLNAGNLPDGRAFLVSNAMVNVGRDPLYISTTDETNLRFISTKVLVSCHFDVFKPFGCVRRFSGSTQPGCQYPQALVINEVGFLTIFSLNKEDIWLVLAPLSSI